MKTRKLSRLMKTSWLALALFLSVPLLAKTVYVKPATAGDDVWAGQTENLYTDIQTAYGAAEANDEIWVAAGEYAVSATMIVKNVKIYGGFAGTENSVDERAKVADGKAWEFVNTSTLKINANVTGGVFSITGTGSAPTNTVFWVDGLTLDGDKANGRTGRAMHIQGGGSGSNDIRFTNCIIQNFKSGADGGAFNIRNQGATVSYCLIQNNEGNKGGAGYFEKTTIHHCDIIANSVPTNQTSYQGSTNGGGGGLFLAPQAGTVAYDCYIAENTASFGGGAFVRSPGLLYNCIIVENISQISGSGVCFEARDNNASVYNCIIANNTSLANGGAGVCFAADGSTRTQILRNSILYNNQDVDGTVVNLGIGKGTVTPTISNNILDKAYDAPLAGTNNVIETDPIKLFTNIANGDYTPPAGFAGLNKGDATGLTFAEATDYAGANRNQGPAIEIGAYEVTPSNQIVSITKSDFVTIVSGDVTEIQTGGNLTITFTLNTGYHSPYVSVNNVRTDITETGGTYTLTISNVAATQTINIAAFEANVLPVSDDTYQRRNGNISGDYANHTYLETRGEPGGYAATPLLKFVPTDAIKNAGYNKVELKLTPLSTNTTSLTYTARQFPTSIYTTIHDVPANNYADMWNSESAPVVGEENQAITLTTNSPITLNVTDDYILDFPAEIILSVIKSSNGTVDQFASLENGNFEYIPQLIFSTIPGDGTILSDNTINDPVVTIKYYTLQGIETSQPVVGNMYVVKTCYQSGKSEAKVMYIY